MTFKVGKSSDYDYVGEVEINTLEELVAYQKANGYSLIIGDHYLEIYDDYRE